MYYPGLRSRVGQFSIGLAFSSNGIEWKKYENNPIINREIINKEWIKNTYNPRVCYDGNEYFMLISGFDGAYANTGIYFSKDGIKWFDYCQNPILCVGKSEDWDGTKVVPAGICKVDSIWYIFYIGINLSLSNSQSIGFALSKDRIRWWKYGGNPILSISTPGTWDDYNLGGGTVLFHDNKFHLWYCAQNYFSGQWQIGYATSIFEPSKLSNITIEMSSQDGFRYLRKIYFGFGKGINAKVSIFNYSGILVKTFSKDNTNSRLDTIEWDGKDEAGKLLSDGIYFCSIKQFRKEILEKSSIKKLLLIK